MAAEPPQQTERTDEEIDAELLPFFDVLPAGGAMLQIRYGWEQDGEPEGVQGTAIVNVFEAQDHILAAYTWTARRWQELVQPAAKDGDQPAEEATDAPA